MRVSKFVDASALKKIYFYIFTLSVNLVKSLFLRLFIPIGWRNFQILCHHIRLLNNPNLLGIIRIPAASHSAFVIG
jgi:hypothetical protein